MDLRAVPILQHHTQSVPPFTQQTVSKPSSLPLNPKPQTPTVSKPASLPLNPKPQTPNPNSVEAFLSAQVYITVAVIACGCTDTQTCGNVAAQNVAVILSVHPWPSFCLAMGVYVGSNLTFFPMPSSLPSDHSPS